MKKFLEKGVGVVFNILFFFTPLILFPKTSELFEFNKIVFIYLTTILIVTLWLTKMVLAKKIIFRRTIIDLPLIIFLISQFLSSLTSIDRHTSFLGYYGRFNGGLLSTLSYSLLYWALVSNLNAKATLKALYFLFASSFLVAIYGVLQHFGVDSDLWVQDVKNRVFSTLGQPNWLATFLAALIPLSWALSLKEKRLAFWGLSILFFIVLLYTKSRSGILGFFVAFIVFWGLTIKSKRGKFGNLIKTFSLVTVSFLAIAFLVGTPWTPNLENIISQNLPSESENILPAEPGGTESGEIRKIVWKGAIAVFRNYPLTGSGVETFAYSFYEFRPRELNLVSEWDFLFNKAHNEYLNMGATSGILGLASYLILIGSSLFLIFKIENPLKYALGAGYISILVVNFFGFSTTTTSLLFYLFPGVAIATSGQKEFKVPREKLSVTQKVLLLLTIPLVAYVLFAISKYWYSDLLFAKGRILSDEENFQEAKRTLSYAIMLSPNEATFRNELAQVLSYESLALSKKGDEKEAVRIANEAIKTSQEAIGISPRNLLLLRGRASILVRLSALDPIYIHEAKDTMLQETKYSPTDAKLFYNLGLAYARIGQTNDALSTLEKTVALKENYRDARYALALLYLRENRREDAAEELSYILTHIDPEDALVQQELHEITGK